MEPIPVSVQHDVERFRRYLENNPRADVNCSDDCSMTPLMRAVIDHNHKVFDLLMFHDDTDVNRYSMIERPDTHKPVVKKSTPLNEAFCEDNIHALHVLLNHKNIDFAKKGRYNVSLLTLACKELSEKSMMVFGFMAHSPKIGKSEIELCLHRLIQANGPMEYLEILMPKVDINEAGLLWTACEIGGKSIFQLLLDHPDIDVNRLRCNITPLMQAVKLKNVEKVVMLMNHPSINVHIRDPDFGMNAFELAAVDMNYDLVGVMIALSKRFVYILPCYRTGVILLEKYNENPGEVRLNMRRKCGLPDEVADVFILLCLLSDNYLVIDTRNNDSCTRFLKMASALPLELQMIISHHVCGVDGFLIDSRRVEEAYHKLLLS